MPRQVLDSRREELVPELAERFGVEDDGSALREEPATGETLTGWERVVAVAGTKVTGSPGPGLHSRGRASLDPLEVADLLGREIGDSFREGTRVDLGLGAARAFLGEVLDGDGSRGAIPEGRSRSFRRPRIVEGDRAVAGRVARRATGPGEEDQKSRQGGPAPAQALDGNDYRWSCALITYLRRRS